MPFVAVLLLQGHAPAIVSIWNVHLRSKETTGRRYSCLCYSKCSVWKYRDHAQSNQQVLIVSFFRIPIFPLTTKN